MDSESVETQNQILDAAMQNFAEHGYRGTSISKIAECAGVSKSLIFWYFENKGSLFQSLVDRFVKSCIEKLAKKGPEGNAQKKIESLIDIYWKFICNNLQFVRIFMNWFMQVDSKEREKTSALREIHQQFHQLFTNFIQEGIDQKIFRKDLDVSSTSLFLVSALEGLLLETIIQRMEPQRLKESFFESLKTNLMQGLLVNE